MEQRNATRPRRRSVKKIVVIGTGRMGGAFATAFAKRTSHDVSIRGSHAGSFSAGGHFAAWEQPALHAKEIRDCFAKVR